MNAMMTIACEGDCEAFCRKALSLLDKEEPSTLQLNVPNEWWAQYCINIFSEAVEQLPDEELSDDIISVDIIFNVADGNGSQPTQLTDEEIQDLIDELMDELEDEDDDDA